MSKSPKFPTMAEMKTMSSRTLTGTNAVIRQLAVKRIHQLAAKVVHTKNFQGFAHNGRRLENFVELSVAEFHLDLDQKLAENVIKDMKLVLATLAPGYKLYSEGGEPQYYLTLTW